mmetsp:Transcript_19971/g.33443  ORF Transcript_19971/g.33443 Transcript_19971/m.33443 type:complete len:120 (+) Transcript_19971:271-630(+)
MSVQSAWDNHFAAFGAQDADKILLDYTEESVIKVWDTVKGEMSTAKGLDEIKGLFLGLFKQLSDLGTLAAPVVDVQDPPGMPGTVFLVWECPGSGVKKATDTFVFKGDKIMIQNVVIFG